MRQTPRPIAGTAVDRRTALGQAKDELTESLRLRGDAAIVAVVIRFIDQMRDITDRVMFSDYSAERFAFGRVATELDAAATRAGLRAAHRAHDQHPTSPRPSAKNAYGPDSVSKPGKPDQDCSRDRAGNRSSGQARTAAS
jgi:hypothetical protein